MSDIKPGSQPSDKARVWPYGLTNHRRCEVHGHLLSARGHCPTEDETCKDKDKR